MILARPETIIIRENRMAIMLTVRLLRSAAGLIAVRFMRSSSKLASAECPLYPQKRTLELSRVMSAFCQKRTLP